MVQYSELHQIPQLVRELVANKVALLDQYVLCQTGEREYTALIYNTSTKECKEIKVVRGEDNVYTMAETAGTWEYTIVNECYAYSNVGRGASLDLPVMEGVTAHADMIVCVALMFAIVFKGVLFPCLKPKRKGL